MKIFVCIDDTDNLDSIGTGELLENMMCEASLNNLCSSGMTVRYQLFIHDDIPYTSHNSSMCCNAQTDNLDALIKFCEEYLVANSAEGSDPGLCILTDDDSLDYTPLIGFGRRAQREVLTKDEAYRTALVFGKDVHLSEHGGTGGGVIGALAGAALRAGKEEGRIKGKLQPVPGKTEWTADEFSKMFGVQSFTDEEGREIKEPLSFVFMHPTKLIYRGGLVTAVIVNENGRLMPKPKIKKAKK